MKKKPVFISFILLVTIVFLEALFLKLHLFQFVPNIGILFHITGGFSIGIIAFYSCYEFISTAAWYIQFSFIIGNVSTAALGWEALEWIGGKLLGRRLQGSLGNTMEDLCVGVIGGVLAVLLILWVEKKSWRNG